VCSNTARLRGTAGMASPGRSLVTQTAISGKRALLQLHNLSSWGERRRSIVPKRSVGAVFFGGTPLLDAIPRPRGFIGLFYDLIFVLLGAVCGVGSRRARAGTRARFTLRPIERQGATPGSCHCRAARLHGDRCECSTVRRSYGRSKRARQHGFLVGGRAYCLWRWRRATHAWRGRPVLLARQVHRPRARSVSIRS
jgi:hypothetical protein